MGSRWGCGCELLLADSLLQREQSGPSSFSPALQFSQHLSGIRKIEPARTKVLCLTLAWASKPVKKNSHRTKVKTGGPWLLRDNCAERRRALHFFLGSRGVPQTWLFPHWGLADHSHGVLIEGAHDPGGGVWGLCESHPICMGQNQCVGRPHTQRQGKGKNTWELHLCLAINTLWKSLYTGLCLFASLPCEVHPPWGSWRLLGDTTP